MKETRKETRGKELQAQIKIMEMRKYMSLITMLIGQLKTENLRLNKNSTTCSV